MASGKTSKTARASMPKTGGGKGPEMSSDIARFIPLGGKGMEGMFAYVLTPSATVHAKVGSAQFLEAVSTLVDTSTAPRAAMQADQFAERYGVDGWAQAARLLRGEETSGSDEN